MAVRNDPQLVGFDVEAVLDIALEATDDGVFICAEFTPEAFNILYASAGTMERYDDVTDLEDVGERIHGYINLDFAERGLFQDLLPPANETHAFVTHTDYVTVARVLASDDEGVYLSFEPDTDVSAVVDRVTEFLA
jgi:hypothetical protein